VLACAATSDGSEVAASERKMEIVPAKLAKSSARAIPAGKYGFEDSEEWEEFWSKHNDTAAPDFDFEKFALVAVFLGQKPNPGHSVKIVGAVEQENETVVEVVEYVPSPGMMFAQVIVYPFDAVLVPATGKPIRFSVSKKSGRP
jgi:hypothetical protein